MPFQVGDYAMYKDEEGYKREVKIINALASKYGLYLVEWHDIYEGRKEQSVRERDLSPVPGLQDTERARLQRALKEIVDICTSAGRHTTFEEIQEIAEAALKDA